MATAEQECGVGVTVAMAKVHKGHAKGGWQNTSTKTLTNWVDTTESMEHQHEQQESSCVIKHI